MRWYILTNCVSDLSIPDNSGMVEALTYEVLQVDPVHDSGSGRYDGHVLEGRVDPLQELEPLLVPLHLRRPVLLQR